MFYKFIVNPVAGRGRTRRQWPEVERFLRTLGLEYQANFTQKPGDATVAARAAKEEGFDAVVAVGGDGTIQEVANGLQGTGLVLGVLPTGTGNDFARSMELPRSIEECCRVLTRGRIIDVDLGRVDGSYFLNVAGAGFDAEVARMASEDVKFLRGTAAFVFATMYTLLSFTPAEFVLELDGQQRRTRAMMVAVANGRYFGGGMLVAPGARMDDGLFDVCIIGALGKLEFARVFPSVFKGEHVQHPKVSMVKAERVQVSAEGSRVLSCEADGNLAGVLPKEFEVIPGAQRLLVP